MPKADPAPVPLSAADIPDGAVIIEEPVSTVDPDTNKQPVANPSEEAKATYRKTLADGRPLEIDERPARLAALPADAGEFQPETAAERSAAQVERAKAAAKAGK